MIDYLSQVDPATWATVAAGVGTTVGTLGARWFGHRSAVRKIEAGATARVAGGYGDLLTDLQEQLRQATVDRHALHDDIALLRIRLREVESTARIAATKFEQLLEHVRVLRAILGANQIEHPPGPDFLDDGGAS